MNVAPLTLRVQRTTAHPLFPAIAIAGLGVALLLGAYGFQYLGGFAPCPLCLEERWPWRVLIVIGAAVVAAHALKAPPWVTTGLYMLAAAVALYSAYLGGFHAGVEYKWWPGPKDCSGGPVNLPSDGPLLGGLSSSEVVQCDKIVWSLFWISMAGYNFLFSLVALTLGAFGAWKGIR